MYFFAFERFRQIPSKRITNRDILDKRRGHPGMQLCTDLALTIDQKLTQGFPPSILGGNRVIDEVQGYWPITGVNLVRTILVTHGRNISGGARKWTVPIERLLGIDGDNQHRICNPLPGDWSVVAWIEDRGQVAGRGSGE